ncbi:tetratricopeptide repeat protein [Candidatus Thorarchaeota archaeon]|nr:MAG: tetratricopeptide repeat protein [Candidatus Thorarchaeota archaeon]
MSKGEEKWDLFERALELLSTARWAEAEATFDKLIALEPDKYINWLMLGRCQLSQQKLDEAMESALKALDLKEAADTWNLMGCVLKSRESFAEAENAFRKSLEINPRDATSWSGLATVLFALNHDKESEEAAKKSIELKPEFFEGWLALGMLHLRQGHADESETYFRKLAELAPRMPEAHEFLAVSLSAQGKHREAGQARERARSLRS